MSHLYYIHDPMCSWCWGFRPVLEELMASVPPTVSSSRLLGGLAADSSEPMPGEMRLKLQNIWREIEKRIPNTSFNFAFWSRNTPRRSTYPACRAVIAARTLNPDREESMILAIQQAYYLQARNPSDEATLGELATEIGLDKQGFIGLLNHASTQRKLESEISQARQLGVSSFPSLVLERKDGCWPIRVDYLSPEPMLKLIAGLLEDD